MKLFNLFKRKKNKKAKFEQYSRDELGLLPEKENSNEDIFVSPKERQEYVSTLKVINTEEDTPAIEEKSDSEPTKKGPDSNESTKKNTTKNANTATKSKAETKSPP